MSYKFKEVCGRILNLDQVVSVGRMMPDRFTTNGKGIAGLKLIKDPRYAVTMSDGTEYWFYEDKTNDDYFPREDFVAMLYKQNR